jgi:hypothetical protein
MVWVVLAILIVISQPDDPVSLHYELAWHLPGAVNRWAASLSTDFGELDSSFIVAA